MAAAYPAPPCLSCASPAARDPLPTLASVSHQIPPLLLSCSAGCRIRASSIALSTAGSCHRRRRRQSVHAFSNKPEVITTTLWNDSVLNCEVPVLVELWAPWCGPCSMVHRVIEEIAREYAGSIKCFKLNTDEYPQVPTFYKVEQIPTVLLFKNGVKLESFTGTMPKSVYVAAIERSLTG